MNSGRLAALEQRWWATLRPKPDPFESKGGGGEEREGGQREKGTYPPLLERRLSIRNRFSGHVREYPRSEMGSSMMQAFDVSI